MTTKKNSSNRVSSVLKGEFITGNNNSKLAPFLLLLVLLGLLNIRSSFHAEKLLKEAISLEKEIADLRLTHITTKSKLMGIYRRSVVEELVKDQELKTSLIPPKIIEKE